MKWYNEMPNTYEEELVKGLVGSFGVELCINYKLGINNMSGCANVKRERIHIFLPALRDYKTFLSVVFHELSHVLEGRMGKFELYHNRSNLNRKEKKRLIRTALKAERFVDKKAKEMMKCFFPGIPYKKAYRSKESVRWFRSEFLQSYR